MNKIGLHNGHWLCTPMENCTVFEMLELTKRAECEVLEIGANTVLELSSADRVELKKQIADAGMGLTVNGGFDFYNDPASDNAEIRRAGIEKAKKVIEYMTEAGANNWSGINYSEWLRRPSVPLCTPEYKKHVLDLSIQSMKEIVKVAADYGVDYCFEIVNRFEQFLLNTAEEGVAFCEAVDMPNAKLLLDTFHMNIEEDNIADAIRYAQAKGRLGHIHTGESNRRTPGFEGKTHMDWDAIGKAVVESGYTGVLTMEPFMKMGPTTICVWRDLSRDADIDTMVKYAKDGANFLRSKLV